MHGHKYTSQYCIPVKNFYIIYSDPKVKPQLSSSQLFPSFSNQQPTANNKLASLTHYKQTFSINVQANKTFLQTSYYYCIKKWSNITW